MRLPPLPWTPTTLLDFQKWGVSSSRDTPTGPPETPDPTPCADEASEALAIRDPHEEGPGTTPPRPPQTEAHTALLNPLPTGPWAAPLLCLDSPTSDPADPEASKRRQGYSPRAVSPAAQHAWQPGRPHGCLRGLLRRLPPGARSQPLAVRGPEGPEEG